jgi:hypothetical protein
MVRRRVDSRTVLACSLSITFGAVIQSRLSGGAATRTKFQRERLCDYCGTLPRNFDRRAPLSSPWRSLCPINHTDVSAHGSHTKSGNIRFHAAFWMQANIDQPSRFIRTRPKTFISLCWSSQPPSRSGASLASLPLRASQLSCSTNWRRSRMAEQPQRLCQSRGLVPVFVHQFISLSARCSSRWWARHSWTINSSLTFCPSSRACANRGWCDRRAVAHTLCRVGARQNADASCHRGAASTVTPVRSYQCGPAATCADSVIPAQDLGSGLFQVSQPGSERPSHLVAIISYPPSLINSDWVVP